MGIDGSMLFSVVRFDASALAFGSSNNAGILKSPRYMFVLPAAAYKDPTFGIRVSGLVTDVDKSKESTEVLGCDLSSPCHCTMDIPA